MKFRLFPEQLFTAENGCCCPRMDGIARVNFNKQKHISALHSTVGIHFCSHDYVMMWKRFPHHWLFVRGINLSPMDSQTATHSEWFLLSWPSSRGADDLKRHAWYYTDRFNHIFRVTKLANWWIQFPNCQWINSNRYGNIVHINPLKTERIYTDKQRPTKLCA